MIEVGEYIRTSRGKIGKLIRIEFDKVDEGLKWYVFLGKDEFGIERELYINKPYIVKHNEDITKLIEAGDYVNGRKVYQVGYNFQDDYVLKMSGSNYEDFIYPKEIKSIVTKEQFESVSFKV